MSSSRAVKSIETFETQGIECKLHKWIPSSSSVKIKAACIIYHGFKAHAEYPTVRYLAELLSNSDNQYAVYALDMPGHGLSPGKKGFIESSDVLIKHAANVAKYVVDCVNTGDDYVENAKVFLCGSSMGGAIALMVSKELETAETKALGGVVMLAPMLQMDVSMPTRYLLRGLAKLCPSIHAIPSSSSDDSLQYRDPIKMKEAAEDKLSIGGNVCFGSASALVELCYILKESYETFRCPMLVLIADEDYVVDSVASKALATLFPSSDKTIKHYKALHGLLCEPQPLLGEIENDVINWISSRVKV